ncbi:MAG: endonuclease/exonuclease/phosphatase family protein [Crocinitomicaceae bacterium]|nr:endonuclease/exonuclease/phosphatase family protein [Crocinitomicaceae bacterium]
MAKLKRIFSIRTLLLIVTILVSVSLILAYLSPYIHPETSATIQLFGLAYPIIILCHLTLLVIWILLRSKWAIFLGVLVLLGGELHMRTFAWGSGDEQQDEHVIKVLSYNVRLFDRFNIDKGEGDKTKDKIFDYLNKEQPDIACFQEFYHQDQPTSFVTKDSLIGLLEAKDYHERYSHKLSGRQNFGIAIFSKYPMIAKGDIIFPATKKNFNYCIFSDIVVKKDTFRVYNVHMQSIRLQPADYALFEEENLKTSGNPSNFLSVIEKIKDAYPIRTSQAQKLIDHIKTSPHPVIVCGDFNDTPLSYCYNQFNSILTDAFRNSSFGIGKTYAGKIPAGRIDYIFHSPEIGSNTFKIQKEKLSDHYAILCSLFQKQE